MAYKVVCTKCGHPVKVQSDGTYWFVACKCQKRNVDEGAIKTWEIQVAGIIPQSDRQKYCAGCEDNFYNQPGNSNTGHCWMLDKAKVIKKQKIGINDVPPYTFQPIVTTLNCYKQKGYVFWTP